MELAFHNVRALYLIEIGNAIHQQTHVNTIVRKVIILFAFWNVNLMNLYINNNACCHAHLEH